jgi:hypothetical protein
MGFFIAFLKYLLENINMSTAELDTKQNWDDCHFDQFPGHSIHLSGQTVICGQLKICGPTGFSASYGAGQGKAWVSNASGIGTWEVAKGESLTKLINQTSHGFNCGDVIGFGSGVYSKPIANGAYNGEVLGIVSKCYNANCFDLTQAGYVTGLTGLVANCTYFLSPSVAGLLTTTEPSTPGQIDKSVLIATSTSTGWVLPYPGYYITSGGSGGSGTLTGATNGVCKYDSANVCLGGTITGHALLYASGTGNDLTMCSIFNSCCGSMSVRCGGFLGCGVQTGLGWTGSITASGTAQFTSTNGVCSNDFTVRPDAIYVTVGGGVGNSGMLYTADYCTKFNANCRSIPDVDWVKRWVTANTTSSMSGTANRLTVFNATGNNVCNTTATFTSNVLCNNGCLTIQAADNNCVFIAAKNGSTNYLIMGSPTQAGVGNAYICPAGTSTDISIFITPKGAGASNYIIAPNNYIGPSGLFCNGFAFTTNTLTLPSGSRICGQGGGTAFTDATTMCICGGVGYGAIGYAGAGGSIFICGGYAVDGIGGTPKAGGDVMIKSGAGVSGGASGLICMCGQVCASSTITASNFILSSDCRLKTCIEPISISPINVEYKQYELISEPNQIRYGVIAQDLQKVNPELVRVGADGMLTIAQMDFVFKELAYLKNKVAELENRLG